MRRVAGVAMRRALIAGAAALVVIGGGHALVWRWAVQTVSTQYAVWVAQQRAAGWIVTSGEPMRGGYPLAAQLVLPQTHIEEASKSGPSRIGWTGERVVLGVALLHPRTLVISAEGLQRLRLANDAELPFRADRLTATIPLEPGAPARSVDIAATNLRAGLPMPTRQDADAQGDPPTAAGLTVALLALHAESKPSAAQGEAALSFSGSAQDIGLPPPPAGRTWPLGARIASVSLEGAVNGPVPRLADPTAKATGWRDGGGTLEIGRFAIGWGPLGLNGSATLALDEHMQPMGTAAAHILGYAEALDALALNGAITPRTASAAKVVLSLMAKEPEGGGAPQVDVPLTLQDRKLAMGRIPLAILPELVWPGAP
jgi:hypothetical protein